MKPYAPLGLLYLSGYLNEQKIQNHVFDATFSNRQEQLYFIENKKPKLVAIYTNLMTKINVIKLVKILLSEEKYGFPKIALGGPDVTYNLENYLKTGAHFIIIGEGEQTITELYQAISNKTDITKVTGIAYLENDQLTKTPPRVKLKDISTLPLPNREGIAIEKYLDTWKTHHGKSSMTISTQRGCPYTCKWCSTAVYGQSYRRRPAKLVVEEMGILQKNYKPDSIWFVDDVFTVSHKWIKEFHEETQKQNIKIPFECITRAERLNDEILQLLKEAGCFRIWIGAESGSQKILDAMDKGTQLSQIYEATRLLKVKNVKVAFFIQFGYLGETKEDIAKTIAMIKELQPDDIGVSVSYPLPGTKFYEMVKDDLNLKSNWRDSDDLAMMFQGTFNSNYYKKLHRYVHKEYRKSQAKTDPSLAKNILNRFGKWINDC